MPTRREILRLVGVAAVAAVADACTSGASNPASTSPVAPPSTPVVSAPGSSAPAIPAPGPPSSPARPSFAGLAERLSGRLARPGESSYRPGALLYNPRFADQPEPAAIAYCASRDDVAECVRFAAEGGAGLRIRNGGHSYGGWSSGPGLVADLSAMDGVRVDRSAGTATIGAGALLARVYSRLDAQGVSIGAGSCATVGVTGLTLGGGVGLLTRRYGLTCDQLASATVVTANGRTRRADAHEQAELFWALRGGGGSFGAVTSLTFDVRPAPRVQEVFLQWPGSDAADVLAAWQDWTRHTPRELWSTCKVLVQPGSGMRAIVAAYWTGNGSPATQVRRLLRATPPPTINTASSNPYGVAMLAAAGCHGSADACITAALTPAQRLPEAAASSILQRPLPERGVRAIVDAVRAGMDVANMVEGGVSFDALGGAVADVAVGDTAFPWRGALADIQYTATWPYEHASRPRRYDRFVQSERTALLPWVGNSGYVNYADPGLTGYPHAYWGPNLDRLTKIKKAYDPHNVFTFPQAVPI